VRNLLWPIWVALLVAVGCSGPAPPPFKPVVDNRVLMLSVMEPSADYVWDSVKSVITNSIEEFQPKTDEEWDLVVNHTIVLAESGNLLMMVPRAKDGGDWMKFSQALIDASTEAMQAASAKDPERLFTAGGTIYEACLACHQKYLPAADVANQ
jgi:hypothetical protein